MCRYIVDVVLCIGGFVIRQYFAERYVFLFFFHSSRFAAAVSHVLLFFQIVASSGFCFFFFHKLVQVVFPSPGRSASFPLSSC